MGQIKSFSDYKKVFDFDINKNIDSIMNNLSKDIIELNQKEQLSEGIDSKGQTIKTLEGNPYTKFTKGKRAAEGLQTNKVDLNFSGRFWKTFKVMNVSGGWLITASFGMYGGSIEDNFNSSFDFLGLTNDNLDYLVHENIMPELEKRLKKQLKK